VAAAVWGKTSQRQHANVASDRAQRALAPSVEIRHHHVADPMQCHRATVHYVFPGLAELGSVLVISIFLLGLLFSVLQRWAATKAQTALQRLLTSWRP
jgi:hypothetical protein